MVRFVNRDNTAAAVGNALSGRINHSVDLAGCHQRRRQNRQYEGIDFRIVSVTVTERSDAHETDEVAMVPREGLEDMHWRNFDQIETKILRPVTSAPGVIAFRDQGGKQMSDLKR